MPDRADATRLGSTDAVSGTCPPRADASGGRIDPAANFQGASALVQFQRVAKTYDGKSIVVRNLNLDVFRGEFLTLLGPSGSGKTTTLMMLAGFEAPTEGTISLDGISLANVPPHKRDIGVVFQNYALFPHMTVNDNIAFPLSVRHVAASDVARRVGRALDMVRLAGYGDRRPSQLSGGEQQRVALARALVFEPKLILMDEPLGALDRQLREEMQLEIRALHKRLGITAVYVTHDQAEALTMSDRIAVFNQGAIQQLDTPISLYESPTNAFVARFVGENNRLEGIIEERCDRECVVRLRDDTRIRAMARDIGPVGDAATVTVRPEQIFLTTQSAESGAEPFNRVSAKIREVIHLGDHLRVHIELAGAGEAMLKLPRDASGIQPSPGSSVYANWRILDCLAFAPEVRSGRGL